MSPSILILPGWQDSGPEHWQSLWLKKYPNAVKVEQRDWMNPKKDDWVATLNEAIDRYEEVILVGHSLACATFAHWAKENPEARKVRGALFVCPSDVELPNFPPEIQGFSPMPLLKLPFKTIVVTSENDKWVSLERAQLFSDAWGADLVNIGPAGHINTDSGFGEWPEGEKLLAELIPH